MANKVNIPVLVGEKEELHTIAVTNEEYIQIMKGDERLLQKLITEETERRSANTVQQFVNDNNEIVNNFNNTSEISDNTEENQKNDENKETFTWPEKAILLFLELYREREHEFTTGLKRHNKL